MDEKSKVTIEDLHKRIGEVKDYTEKTRKELQETIKKKPLESAGAIFIAGVIIGLIIGTAISRR
jgi:F0F1-type ATP synthase assembly protein I